MMKSNLAGITLSWSATGGTFIANLLGNVNDYIVAIAGIASIVLTIQYIRKAQLEIKALRKKTDK